MTRFLPLSAAAVAGLFLAACATTAPAPPRAAAPPPPPPPPPTPAEEFAWSTGRGNNTLTGIMAYRPNPATETWSCANMGSAVALMPETSYSRGRIIALYGSADRALQSVAQVRARSAANPGADYGQFVRSTACDPSDSFTFSALPDGAYFIIARVRQTRPANAGGEMVVMQRVELRGGQAVRMVLPQGMAAPPPARPAARPPARPPARR